MTRVKFYNNQRLSDIEKNVNEFLKKEEVKELIDIKFNALNKDGIEEYSVLIIYEENMKPCKEDPQVYE